jgi:hypothetical protein
MGREIESRRGICRGVAFLKKRLSNLALVDSSVGVSHPAEDEYPVVRLCRVKDLEPRVGREDEVAVRQDVKVAPADERNLQI